MKALFLSWALLGIGLVPAAARAEIDLCQPDLEVAPGAGNLLGATANLCTPLPRLQTSLNFAVQANPASAPVDPLAAPSDAFFSNERVGLNLTWGLASGDRLDLSAGDRMGQTRNLMSLATTTNHQIDTDERNATAALTLTPLSALDVRLTGSVVQRSVFDSVLDPSAPKTQSQFVDTTQQMGVGVKWSLSDWFSLDAAGKTETANVVWRGAAASAGLAYAYFEPSLTAALTMPGRGKLDLTFEHAVSPIDAGALSSFAAVEDRSVDARFEPNREWRYGLKFDQPLAGAIDFDAALIRARLESSTELGPVGVGLQAPISDPGGERSQVDVSLSAPLAVVGLPSFTLKGASSWRSSRIRDPFTGDLRPMSGETPQVATIDLIQSLPSKRARWGLEGRFGGDQSLYQMSQVTSVAVGDSLGGFVEYNPGVFALRLQVDGLYGGDRSYTDTYYAGARGDGSIDHVDHRSDSSQAVRLILSKGL